MEGTMPIRFRKTFTLFPGVRVNLSKGGMSISVGRQGFTLNFSKRGVRQTTGLPGSGISHTSYLFKNDPESEDEDEKEKEAEKEERASEATDEKPKQRRTRRSLKEQASSPWGFFAFVFIALFFIYFGADALGLLPPNLVTNFLSTLTQWARQVGL
jgi:hypothetical protein